MRPKTIALAGFLLSVMLAVQAQDDPLAILEGIWVTTTPPIKHVAIYKVGLGREASLPFGQASIRPSDATDGSHLRVSGAGFDCYYWVATLLNQTRMVWEYKSGSAVCLKSMTLDLVERFGGDPGRQEIERKKRERVAAAEAERLKLEKDEIERLKGEAASEVQRLKREKDEAERIRMRLIEDPALSVRAGSGESFRDLLADGRSCNFCPEMAVVPAGSFTMGSPPGEKGREPREGPQRRVTIARPFAVGKFEVTFAEWDACYADGGCRRPDDDFGRRGRHPVIRVSWDDITKGYLPWLSRKTGKSYRLLSEAEWEYAARARSTTRYHFGDSERDLCTYGNVADLSMKGSWNRTEANCHDGRRSHTAPVGSYQPNAFGLFDMHGNVWEWVQDCYHENYNGAPSDGSAWTTGDCVRRVLRGGSWFYGPQVLRVAFRNGDSRALRNQDFGFRVGRTH